ILLVNDVGELCLRAVRTLRGLTVAAPIGQPLDIALFPRGQAPPAVIAFHEVDQRREYHDLFDLPDPHACLAATLVLQDEHLGYLVVDRLGADRYPVEEAELIGAFASQASVAIENARLYTAQREQAWVSTALLQVAEALAPATGLEETLATLVRLTPMLVGVSWCAVLLANGERFDLRGYHHLDDVPLPELPAGLGAADWPALAELLTNEAPAVTSPDDPAPEALRGLLDGVAILLPIWIRGAVQGVLAVGQAAGEAGSGPAFTTHRIRLIGGIATQAALALDSALLDEAQQEEAWVTAALLQVAEALAGQPTLAEALETVLRLTPMLVGVERAAVFRWQPEREDFQLVQRVGLTLGENASLSAPAEALGLNAFAPGAAADLCRLTGALAEAFGGELAMVWPLWARRDLRGALVVAHVGGLGRRRSILDGIAHQLAMAMENAALAAELTQQQRIEREMELGRDIQASFLPEACPQAPGWDMAAFWRSARLVGGDFYDFIRLRSTDGVERWGIGVADVSDKGVPAALFMALSRTLLRSAAIHRTSPAATLTRVNELILADARSQQFVTVYYAIWEPATGRLLYANAGHNPPVLVTAADGEARILPARGAALGVFAEYLYTEHELYFQPGDTLLFYTDGLTDAINAEREDFGLERVKAVVRAARSLPAASIVDTLAQTVDYHVAGVEAFDDMTMVVLKRTETG
ncbi:MAG: SpoIIE family protein phosphatase, partial [Anaerolineales bacterium]|nr:SpoIIE family protein phosphatase [Anaerolineales bacterium]